MQQFRIRENGFKEIRKKILIRIIPLMLIVATAAITISTINSKNDINDTTVLPFIIPFTLSMMAVGIFRGTRRQKNLFASYTLTITNNLVTREQINTPEISIYFNEIKEIIKHSNGSFSIRGKDSNDIIGIPRQIENYAQLETRLAGIKTITVKKSAPLLEKYPFIAGIVAAGLMVCVYTINNKTIVALTGTALIALIVWSIMKIRNSKNIDTRTKRISWMLVLVLASIILVIIFKLTGVVDIHKP